MEEIKKYPLSMRVMHWILGIMILGMLGVGFYMSNLPDNAAGKWVLYALHKSFGVIVVFLVCIRLLIRLRSSIPIMPKKISSVEVTLAGIAVLFLYISMFIMPLSGYISSMAAGYGVKFFAYDMPPLFQEKNLGVAYIAMQIHKTVPYFLILVLFLHIVAPLKHLIVDKVNIFKRII